MAILKSILNNSKLVEIKVDDNQKNWYVGIPTYEYYYFDIKIAEVTFNGSRCEVSVHETYAPWAHLLNNEGSFFARIHKVEDQLHGVNIIDMDNLQSLFIELETNLNIKRGKEVINTFTPGQYVSAQMFANMFANNAQQAIQQAGSNFKTISNVSKFTFPKWGRKKK